MTESNVVFDLAAFLAEATYSGGGGLYGEFQKAVVLPGFYSFATGLDFDKRFVEVKVGEPDAMRVARDEVLKLGEKFAIGYSLRLIAGTRVNEDPEHKQEKDYIYTFKKSSEKVDGVYREKFDWVTFFNSLQEHVPADWYGQEIWVHVAGKKNPEFDPEDSITWNYDTVQFKAGEMVMDNEGKPRPRYHRYIAAAFRTREELVEYMAANGVEMGDIALEKNYPIPAGWTEKESDWPECAVNIVANIAEGTSLKKLHDEWHSLGVTLEDLKNMRDILNGEVPA